MGLIYSPDEESASGVNDLAWQHFSPFFLLPSPFCLAVLLAVPLSAYTESAEISVGVTSFFYNTSENSVWSL